MNAEDRAVLMEYVKQVSTHGRVLTELGMKAVAVLAIIALEENRSSEDKEK